MTKTSNITISGPDGDFGAYLAEPASGHGSGVIIIQEIFGINSFVREMCEAHSAAGRFALAPDLFWRLEPGVQLTDKTKEDWAKALDLMNRFDVDKGVVDIGASIKALRNIKGLTQKVGAVGFCLGGLLAYLTACHTDSDATVGYYGVNIQNRLADAKGIKKPLMLHMAGRDGFVPADAQKSVMDALSANPLVTIHRYEHMDHAFARTGGEHYDKAQADLANGRTDAFFAKYLS